MSWNTHITLESKVKVKCTLNLSSAREVNSLTTAGWDNCYRLGVKGQCQICVRVYRNVIRISSFLLKWRMFIVSTIIDWDTNIWVATLDFQQCGMCDQLRLRPAYAQSDQSLFKSLEYSMTVKPVTEHHLELWCLKGGSVYTCQNAILLGIFCHWPYRLTPF